MCISAEASFGASAILLIGGIVAVKKAHKPSQLPFAAIPILFAAQQFVEGFIWLSLTNENYSGWNSTATIFFLVFAQVFWPLWVPLSILMLERDARRKKALLVLTLMGSCLFFYHIYSLYFYSSQSIVSGYHIRYVLDFPNYAFMLCAVFYVITAIVPFFVSSIKKMKFMGSFVLLSFLISKLFFSEYLISIWCYFAALNSLIILWVMSALQKSALQKTD